MRKLPPLIGLHGPARCGKDTTAKILAEVYGYKMESFAGPIRKAVAGMLGYENVTQMEPVKDNTIASIGASPRRLMQTLGTEWGRATVHPDFWVNALAVRCRLACNADGHSRYVITDVRFDNEAEWIRDSGGVVVHIRRPEQDTIGESGHASEAGVAYHNADWILTNDGTVTDLADALTLLIIQMSRNAA